MGTFFKEKKESGRELVQHPVTPRHGFFATAGLMILGFFLEALSWAGKPLFTWLFTFQGESKESVRVKIAFIGILFGGTAFLLYKIPFVQDLVSLSPTHTINLEHPSGRIFFPDRSLFVIEKERRIVRFKEREGLPYLSYSGYSSDVTQLLPKKSCQLVARSKKIALTTVSRTLQAEGFEDRVTYKVTHSFQAASLYRRMREYFFHPRYITTSRAEKNLIMLTYFTTTSWKEFEKAIADNAVWFYEEDKAIPFETKALASEHAVICAF